MVCGNCYRGSKSANEYGGRKPDGGFEQGSKSVVCSSVRFIFHGNVRTVGYNVWNLGRSFNELNCRRVDRLYEINNT